MSRKAAGHFTAKRGKRVLVLMHDGQHFVAKFKDHHDREITFYDHDPVIPAQVRTLSIYKGPRSLGT